MKIISKFKDYYDCMLKYGQDDLVWYRNTRTYPVLLNPKLTRESQQIKDYDCWDYVRSSTIQVVRIFVCDNEYTLFKYNGVIYYSVQDLFDNYKEDKYNSRWYTNPFCRANGDCKPSNLQLPQYPEYKSNVPVYILARDNKDNWIVIENPKLLDFNFAKVLHPHDIYNQIYNWLCNQAKPMKPIPEMSDKTKIDSHGFNKFSFRKEKRES